MRLWIPFLIVAAAGPAAWGREGDICPPALGTLIGPAYGTTARTFRHELKGEGPVDLKLTTWRVRASDGSEVVQFRVWRPNAEEPIATMTFEFTSPTEGFFRGVVIDVQRSGLGTVLYQELMDHPEFKTIRKVTSKYIDDNESGMIAALEAVNIPGPYDANPKELLEASQRINPKTGKPFVPATNLWDKIGFRTSKVVYDKFDAVIRVEYERKPSPR